MHPSFEHIRTLPKRMPPGHEPPVPRQRIELGVAHDTVISLYLGVQAEAPEPGFAAAFHAWCDGALARPDGPYAHERARFTDKFGVVNELRVAYWIDEAAFDRWMAAPEFAAWWTDPAHLTGPLGYWCEVLRAPRIRLETNYSGTDYRPGLAAYPGSTFVRHVESGYWGAMRDRVPLSAIDPLESPLGTSLHRAPARETKGARWRVEAPLNLAAIRSGQYWEIADEEQEAHYLRYMRPVLLKGMDYLESNREKTGCCTLRMATNLDEAGRERRETFGLGYFLSLTHLEAWSEHHATHKAIYGSAIAAMKTYGKDRKVRTWHEVFVLPSGGQLFEYVNCHPETGLLPWFEAERLSA